MEKELELVSFVVPTHMPGRGGWGNGYVAMFSGHPCYGMEYDAIHTKYPSISVNGGLTFSQFKHPNQPKETKGMWIVGFDTLHYNDDMVKWPNEQSVMAETKKLEEQLMRILQRKKRKNVHKTV